MTMRKEYIDSSHQVFDKEKPKPANYKDSALNEIQLIHQLVKAVDRVGLKNVCRSQGWGEEHPIRSQLWPLLSLRYKRSRSEAEMDEALVDYLDKSPPGSPHKLPGFVDLTYCRYFYLNARGQRAVEKILWSLARDHPEITFCPLLYPLTALFLHYLEPKAAFISLSNLLEGMTEERESHCLLPKTRTQLAKDAYVLIKLTNKFGIFPQRNFFTEQRRKLTRDHEIDICILEWLKWIFIGLPFGHLIRVVDCFLVEGPKFLFRVGLGLLLLYKRSHSSSGHGHTHLTLENMLAFCDTLPVSPNELIKLGLSITRLSTIKIAKQYKKAEDDIQRHPNLSSSSLGSTGSPFKSPLHSSPRKIDMISLDSEKIMISTRIAPRGFKSNLIDWYLLDIIWDWIPERVVVKEPVVLFCTNEDGSSLRTFFSKTGINEPTILLIKSSNNEIFGAFCSSAWSMRLGVDGKGASSQYFGTGETFLFALIPKIGFYPWVGAKKNAIGASPASHSTQLFMSANPREISVGSGNGVGLWLDEELNKGKSEKCDTFANKPLCASIDFSCSVVEVIGFV